MRRSKVNQLASSMGADLKRIRRQPNGSKEIEVFAPEGYLFNANDGTNLLCIYWPDFGEYASDCYDMIYQDLKLGLREMTDEQKQQYGVKDD